MSRSMGAAAEKLEEYVVSRKRNIACSVSTLLQNYGAAHVIDEFDAGTALVAMPRYVATRLVRDHPELVVEQNLPYKHFKS